MIPLHTAFPSAAEASDYGFLEVLASYRATGGIARGNDLAAMLEDRVSGNAASLAKDIVYGKVFGFYWQHEFWIPMCQYELANLSIKAWPERLRAQLPISLNGWCISYWLTHPNSKLNGRRPLALLDTQLSDVLKVAHANGAVVYREVNEAASLEFRGFANRARLTPPSSIGRNA